MFITECRRPGRFSGNAGVRRVTVRIPTADTVFPLRLVHGYRRFKVDEASVREAQDAVEVLVWLLGHEFGHETKFNERLRRGAQERHSDRCGAELLDKFRARRVELDAEARNECEVVRERAAAAAAGEPQRRLDSLVELRRRWGTRLKRAQNKVRSLDRKIAAQRQKVGTPSHLWPWPKSNTKISSAGSTLSPTTSFPIAVTAGGCSKPSAPKCSMS